MRTINQLSTEGVALYCNKLPIQHSAPPRAVLAISTTPPHTIITCTAHASVVYQHAEYGFRLMYWSLTSVSGEEFRL